MKFHALFCVLMASIFSNHTHSNEITQSPIIQNIIAGGITGYSELITGAPLNYILNCSYQNISVSKNPRVWYQGSAASGFTTGITTAVAASVKEKLSQTINPSGSITFSESLVSAGTAGLISGMVSAPVASIVMHKQKYQESYLQTIKKAPLTKAIVADGFRESGFALLLFAIYPEIKNKCTQWMPNEYMAAIMASFITAPLTTSLTHPAATIGGIIRSSSMNNPNYKDIKNELDALRYLLKNGGVWKGLVPRTVRIFIALPVMGYVYENATNYLKFSL